MSVGYRGYGAEPRMARRSASRGRALESEHRRFGTACLLMALLVACGGGDGDEGLASSCSPSPSINSEPSESASVEEQYRYHVQATVACITFFTPCGVELLEGPPDSGIDPIRVAVYWTPGPEDANRSFRFSVATVRDPCGQRAVQTWNVFVAPTPEQVAAAPGVGPAVVRTIPESGTVSVPLSYEVVADFSEEIAPATLTPASFVVTDAGTGAALAGTIAYASRRAVFTPAGGLPGSATITARVRATVTDLEGNPLAADYAWSFQTSPAPDTTPPMVVAVPRPKARAARRWTAW